MHASQIRRAVQRDDCLASTCRARYPRRTIEVALYKLLLFGMQEDRPLLPRKLQGLLELVDVRHHTEAALSVRMLERIGDVCCLGHRRFPARCKFQQRLSGLGWKVIRKLEQRIARG